MNKRMKNTFLAAVVLVSSAVGAQASGLPVPLVTCLLPPSYGDDRACFVDWIYIPINF